MLFNLNLHQSLSLVSCFFCFLCCSFVFLLFLFDLFERQPPLWEVCLIIPLHVPVQHAPTHSNKKIGFRFTWMSNQHFLRSKLADPLKRDSHNSWKLDTLKREGVKTLLTKKVWIAHSITVYNYHYYIKTGLFELTIICCSRRNNNNYYC